MASLMVVSSARLSVYVKRGHNVLVLALMLVE